MRRLILALVLLLPVPATATPLTVDLQPVRFCTDDDGCTRGGIGKRYLHKIWDQVGIFVNVLDAQKISLPSIETDTAGNLDPVDALYDFAFAQVDLGIADNTAYMGITGPLSGRTLGIAFLNQPGVRTWPFGIAERLGGRFGAAVIAHELGHILGAEHDTAGGSLMNSTLRGSDFADRSFLPSIPHDAFSSARESALVGLEAVADAESPAAVPLPPAAPLLLGAFGLLAWRGRKA